MTQDITRHKGAEKGPREAALRQRDLVRAANVGFWDWDLHSNLVQYSPEWKRQIGYDDHEIGDTFEEWRSRVHPDDLMPTIHRIEEAIAHADECLEVEFRFRHKDDSYRWILAQSSVLCDETGRPVRVFGSHIDITDRKQAEKALRESEGRVRAKLEALLSPEGDFGGLELRDIIDTKHIQSIMDEFYAVTNIGMALLDLEGNVLVATGWQDICTRFHRVHPETARNCRESDSVLSKGTAPGEFRLYRCKNNLNDIVTPIHLGGRHLGNLFLGQFFFEDEPVDREAFRAQARRYGFDEDEYLNALDRVPRWTRKTVHNVMGFYTRFAKLIGQLSYGNLKLARALEHRRQTEQALRDSENNLSAMLNASPESAFLIDAQGKILSCNPVSAERLRLRTEDLIGRGIFDLLPPEVAQGRRIQVEQVIQSAQPATFEDIRDGRCFSHHIYPVRDSAGKVKRIVIFGHDITRFRIAEAALKKQNDLLMGIREVQELFISGHEPETVYREMLHILVRTTESAYGFLDEVMHDPDGTPYKVSLALSDVSWDDESRALYGQLAARQREFHNLDNLAGAPVLEKRLIIANDVQQDPRSRGIPEGHPPLKSFMGIPLVYGDAVIGVAGVANRTDGYTEDMAADIKPLLQTCAAMIWAGRIARQKHESVTALQKSEERYRQLAETANEGIWAMDVQQRTTYVNARMARMLGYQAREMVGEPVYHFMFPDDLVDHKEKMTRRKQGGGGVYERRFRHKDGSEVWTIVSATAVLDDNGQFAGSFAMFTDITARKAAEKALEQSEERFRTVLESLPAAVFAHDMEGRFVMVNAAAARYTGYTREELLNLSVGDIDPDSISMTDRVGLWQRLSDGESVAIESRHVRKDGSTYDVQILINSMTIGGRRLVVAFAIDISERKQLEERYRQAQKMESVGRLAGGVAHDFNNMLGVILGHLDMAMEKVSPSQSLYEDLRQIESAAERSAELTRQLLAFARKETASPKVLDLNVTVSGMLKMLRRLIGEDIELVWEPASDLWRVKMDPSQVDQVLANLCVNARDAIEGTGRITIRTENICVNEAWCAQHTNVLPGDYVQLAVADDGCGMSQETVRQIFEPFFTTKELGRGTGLGLATVYGVVQQNNGFVDVSSDLGRGTVFRVCLPRYEGETNEIRKHAESQKTPLGHETVLLVEDEPALLNLTREMLRKLGYHVLSASSPSEAITLVTRDTREIHLLITDVIMPDMDGAHLTEKLQELRPNMKRLFISGYPAQAIAHHGVLKEGVQFLEKPFSKKKLADRIREILDER